MSIERRITTSCNSCLGSTRFSSAIQDHIFNAFGINIPTWSVVLIGLLFNISAALVTHFLIDGKTNQLNSLVMQMSNNEKEVGLLWGQIEGVERKRETLYLLINQGKLDAVIEKQFSRLLAVHLHESKN
ncbi:MAG: hypothetical protein GY951_17750 [Psychromonas sp.]|nr:hypothetical protein [Alteromonadales bacterium]MCP5079883.1 hypothetical protein [Psychromonas sp.]